MYFIEVSFEIMYNLRTLYPQNSRSLSVEPDHNKSCVSSILKDPSKSKFKHNRSVRFIEPEDFSSEESNEAKSVCQQQSKDMPRPINNFFVRDYLKCYKRESCASQKVPVKKGKLEEEEEKKKVKNSKRVCSRVQSKIVKKNSNTSIEPKFEPKVMNFGFRDKNFYAKLNKFITGKDSVSPDRVIGNRSSGKLEGKNFSRG